MPKLLNKKKLGLPDARPVQLGYTNAYHFSPLVVLTRGPSLVTEDVTKDFNSFKHLRIGVEEGTWADFLLMNHDQGSLSPIISHFVPKTTLLDSLERGGLDVALIELHRFDRYREQHKQTKITKAVILHQYGFNMGMLIASDSVALRNKLNEAVVYLQKIGRVNQLAEKSGLTWISPQL